MSQRVLGEHEWDAFIGESILPLCRAKTDSACIFALVGDLGAGKTTFSKTFLKELGVVRHVQSPTFSIQNSYDISFGDFTKVIHMDIYRIEDLKELEVLHVRDVLVDPKNIVIVEWADKMKDMIPEGATWITFEHDTLETRKVEIK